MSVGRYRKRPVVVEAVQWTGDNLAEVGRFAGEHALFDGRDDALDVITIEGRLQASVGDWIIKGVAGEFYPCRADIFAVTYEEE
jgi:hypothetical protein